MTSNGSDRLFEVDGDGAEPFEEDGLRRRTDFQSRAPRAGADFKEMAIRWLISAGAEIERLDFEIDDIPVDAQVRGSNGRTLLVIIRGTPYEHPQSGFRKTDTLEKAGFRAVHLARCQGLRAACHVGSPRSRVEGGALSRQARRRRVGCCRVPGGPQGLPPPSSSAGWCFGRCSAASAVACPCWHGRGDLVRRGASRVGCRVAS